MFFARSQGVNQAGDILACLFVLLKMVQDFAAEVVTIKGTQTEEDELVVIRNVDVLAKW